MEHLKERRSTTTPAQTQSAEHHTKTRSAKNHSLTPADPPPRLFPVRLLNTTAPAPRHNNFKQKPDRPRFPSCPGIGSGSVGCAGGWVESARPTTRTQF